MLFHFQLRPIEDIGPWTRGGEPFLNWFGLTDGWYWLKCGNEELFRYSNSVLASWKYEGRQPADPPYVDYQVVRLWEDVLGMLPEVLTAVPAELLQKIEPGFEANQWHGRVHQLVFSKEHKVSQLTEDQFDLAVTWLQGRTLDVLHLKGGPRIWLWTDGTTMFIRWDNRELSMDGHSIWASTKGTHTMPLDRFIEEVRLFDRQLITAMEERVKAIQSFWGRPSIQIDVAQVAKEQQERATELSQALNRALDHAEKFEPAHWNEVVEAISYFEQMGFTIPKQS